MKWSPDISIGDVPGSLPPDGTPEDLNLSGIPNIALYLLRNVNDANLVEHAAWKDWLCLTGGVRTFNGASTVQQAWNKAVRAKQVLDFKVGEAQVNRSAIGSSWVTVGFTFSTVHEGGLVGVSSGSLAIVPGGERKWKIWAIASMLEYYEGFGNPDTPQLHRSFKDEFEDVEPDFQVVVIGAGQNGLSQAARLQALGIKYVLLERLPGVGLSWTEKYDTVRQHTLREYNNLPFDRTWKADDDDLLTAKRVTEGFQDFAKRFNLNIWHSVDVSVSSWDTKQHRWTLDVARNDGSGKKRAITCQHLALSIGGGVSQPNRPTYQGEHNFKGEFLLMRDFKNSQKWKGKHGIVIGSGTAGHDIAQDMLNNGLSHITMIQRQSTAIYPVEWICAGQAVLYNTKIPTNLADRISLLMPQKIGSEMSARSHKAYMEKHKAHYDALEQAGFKLDKEATLYDQILRKWGGYYIDIGTSKHIVDGDIKIKSGVAIANFTEDGIAFVDGTHVKADVVVLAAGYQHDYRRQVATLVGADIAENMGEFWGLTKDGDVRGAMQELAPGLWLLAGTCSQARFWSRFVALKMQAGLLGKPLVESNDTEAIVGTEDESH